MHGRRWMENVRRDAEQVFDGIKCLQQHTQDTIFLVARGGRNPPGNFLLHHTDDLRYDISVVQYLKKDLAGYVIGKITDECNRRMAISSYIEIKKITMNKPIADTRKCFEEQADSLMVNFNKANRTAVSIKQQRCKYSGAGADFQNGIASFGQEGGDNFIGNVPVGQEMLSQTFPW
jgi:hypothetical protein